MIIPKEIRGFELTAKERKLYIDNDLTKTIVSDRIRRDWERERWFEPKQRKRTQPLIVQGHVVSEERQKLMKQLGINTNTAESRMLRGMTFDEATTTPLWVEMKMPKQEVIEVIGRIKYLNKQPETIVPYCIPLGVKRRAKEYGIDIDKVKELPV